MVVRSLVEVQQQVAGLQVGGSELHVSLEDADPFEEIAPAGHFNVRACGPVGQQGRGVGILLPSPGEVFAQQWQCLPVIPHVVKGHGSGGCS